MRGKLAGFLTTIIIRTIATTAAQLIIIMMVIICFLISLELYPAENGTALIAITSI